MSSDFLTVKSALDPLLAGLPNHTECWPASSEPWQTGLINVLQAKIAVPALNATSLPRKGTLPKTSRSNYGSYNEEAPMDAENDKNQVGVHSSFKVIVTHASEETGPKLSPISVLKLTARQLHV